MKKRVWVRKADPANERWMGGGGKRGGEEFTNPRQVGHDWRATLPCMCASLVDVCVCRNEMNV